MGWRAVARFVREQQPTTTTPCTTSDGRHVSSLRWPSVRAVFCIQFMTPHGHRYRPFSTNLISRMEQRTCRAACGEKPGPALSTPLTVKVPFVHLPRHFFCGARRWTRRYRCNLLSLVDLRLLCLEVRRVGMLGHLVRQSQVWRYDYDSIGMAVVFGEIALCWLARLLACREDISWSLFSVVASCFPCTALHRTFLLQIEDSLLLDEQ